MKRYSYSERNYAFGTMMLTLRTTIGITQAGLADRLGVSRRAVAEWEAGGQTLHRIWQAHAERAWSLAFNPDGRILPAEAGTAWSSCGRWRVEPWSGQVGIRVI